MRGGGIFSFTPLPLYCPGKRSFPANWIGSWVDPFRESKQDSSGFRFLSPVVVPSALCRLLRVIETKNAEIYCSALQEFTDILHGNPLKQEISDVLGARRTPLARTASGRLSVCLPVCTGGLISTMRSDEMFASALDFSTSCHKAFSHPYHYFIHKQTAQGTVIRRPTLPSFTFKTNIKASNL